MRSSNKHLLVAACATWAFLKFTFAGFACLSNPCVYGICIDHLNSSYTCYCIDGYTGVQCQTNWDECWSSPCLNGGTCQDGVAAFNCTCPDGYTGDTCEENLDECDSNPCFNNATCLDDINGYTCVCPPGYSGLFCETDEAVCNTTEESRCMNGGICIEGRGDSFTCSCLEGWTGAVCETPTDECASSPCLNGGVCVDRHADYACACPFEYTGKNCEVKLHHCVTSPCENDALCLIEDGMRVCYCVPDYHGDRCQFQYDECQLGPRCLNGGTCLDGVDSYTCSCPPNLTGQFCECLITENEQLNCSYILPSVTTLLPSISTESTPSFITEVPSTFVARNVTGPIVTPTGQTTEIMFSTEETRITSEVSTYFVPSSQTSPQVSESTTHDIYSLSETSASEMVSLSSKFTSFGETMSSLIPEVTSSGITETTSTVVPSTSSSISTFTGSVTSLEVSTASEANVTTKTETEIYTFLTESEIPLTSSKIPETSPTEETSTSEILETLSTLYSNRTEESTSTSSPELSSASIVTAGISSELPPIVKSEEPTLWPEESTSPTPISTDEASGTMPSSSEKSTVAISLYPVTAITPFTEEVPSENTTVGGEFTTPVSNESTSEYPVTFFLTTSPRTPDMMTTDTLVPTEFTSDRYPSSTDVPDCSITPCHNGGTCVHTKEGPQCICKFGWQGPLCQEYTGIKIAAFTGRSYLSHRLSNSTGTHIELIARTMAPMGILLYAHLTPHMYMYLYLEDGLLKFQFSCGIQTMLFSEVKFQVNNGFDLVIQVTLELLPPSGEFRRCAASLHINSTLVMSGEQIAATPTHTRANSWLHLAGIPPQFLAPNEAPVTNGFTGCMQDLMIDNVTKNIYRDAVNGYDVTECPSLACLSNPCFGSATCVEHYDKWTCLCPSGFVGVTCEQSICEDNPCQFGSTCVPYPGSGFLCLCPLGKHGIYCEHDLEVGQPSFFSSVGGLASYAAYPIPGAIHNSMELKFKFIPSTVDQIALMVFVGQDGFHDSRADHLSVSFIQGYVVLTWNLGSGPRRIFTPHPVTQRANRPHTVRLGRIGQVAWLMVDNLQNVSSRSPGRLSQLNTRSLLYLGGHESRNFSLLPHDLPLHSGFSGCLFDVELRAGRIAVALQRTQPATGRSVGQCGTSECHEHACQHGGACLHHGATYTCLCPEGWFGPICALRFNPCDLMRHNCSSGATCVPLSTGYECDCPLGKAGTFCERDEALSDVAFSGTRSYLSLPPVELHDQHSLIDIEVRPLCDRGLLMFLGQQDGNSFLSLSLQGGVLELRLASGKLRKRGEPIVVRSGHVLAIGEWHRVVAEHRGRRIFLRVDGIVHSAGMLPGEMLPTSGSPLYLGGAPDLSKLPVGSVSGLPVPFKGCIRQLSLNWDRTALDRDHITAARNIADCDGTGCGGDVCEHGGSCWLDNYHDPHCTCPQEYTGLRCETKVSCMEHVCQNNGRCVKETSFTARCHCPVGWGGDFCEQAVTLGSPQFGGNSYLVVEKAAQVAKHNEGSSQGSTDISFLYLNFSTAEPDGMILWSAKGDEFIGVGVDNGLLKLVWGMDGPTDNKILILAASVADGEWHNLILNFSPNNITLWVDRILEHSESSPGHSDSQPLTTDGVFYLGGFQGQKSVQQETSGHFTSTFTGCIKEFAWAEDAVITDFSRYRGENIQSCDFF